MSLFCDVRTDFNVIAVYGDLRLQWLDKFTSSLDYVVNKARYPECVIDFSNLSSITFSVVPPIASFLRYTLRQNKIEYDYIPPKDRILATRIVNLGLAHYIDHRRYEKPKIKSSKSALVQFLNSAECDAVSDRVINSVLRTTKLDRQHIAALEWALSEITDNVINHSNSPVGGFLIHHKLPNSETIEFTVADSGIGIPRSLGIPDEMEALQKAIQEGVTRNKESNQGNGLYGTYRLSSSSSGLFSIRSRRGSLYVTRDGETHVRREYTPYVGTIVNCQIDCTQPDLIKRAFIFNGKSHEPGFDYVERLHENNEDDILIKAKDICSTFGSRKSGIEARNYIENMLRSLSGNKIVIDFERAAVISSSFADEVFGRLFVKLGAMRFMRSIHIANAESTVEALIDRAISMRAKTGISNTGLD
jgi:anti-sigma regulatory factor (Ser/Thr protein kinase)